MTSGAGPGDITRKRTSDFSKEPGSRRPSVEAWTRRSTSSPSVSRTSHGLASSTSGSAGRSRFTDGDIVMFQAGPMIVSLWDRGEAGCRQRGRLAGAVWGGFTLGYAVADEAEVDALCRDAAAGRRDRHQPAAGQGLRLLRRLRGPRRAHLGGRLDRGSRPARRRHRGAPVMSMTGTAACVLPVAARARRRPSRSGRGARCSRRRTAGCTASASPPRNRSTSA